MDETENGSNDTLTDTVKKTLLEMRGKTYYFLSTTDQEFIGVITLALPSGFVLTYPARLHEDDTTSPPQMLLAPLGIFTFNRTVFVSHEKILMYGEAQPSMVEFYNSWKNDLVERENKYKEYLEEEKKKADNGETPSQSETEFADQTMQELIKSGKIINFHKPTNTTKQ